MIKDLQKHLWPWQSDIIDIVKRVNEGLPYTIVKKYRQSGATEAACWAACLQGYLIDGHTVLCVSQRQKSSRGQYIKRIKTRILPVLRAWKPEFFELVETNKNEIRFPNGSVIRAESNNIEGIRGETKASIICDEFAKWPSRSQEAFHGAIMPIVESKQNKHGFLLIISTPRQKIDNLYATIWESEEEYNQDTGWYRISYDIYDAIDHGIQWTKQEWQKKKASTSDQAYLAREYEGKFSAQNLTYYPDIRPLSFTERPEATFDAIYVGIDVGGTSDPTACLIYAHKDNMRYVLDLAYIYTPDYEEQVAIIATFLGHALEDLDLCFDDVNKIIVDKTAHKTFPQFLQQYVTIPVKGRSFTNKWKKQRAEALLDLIDAEEIQFFAYSTVFNDDSNQRKWLLQDDIALVEQKFTPSGKTTYKSMRQDGRHGDGWSALLCALDGDKNGFQVIGTV